MGEGRAPGEPSVTEPLRPPRVTVASRGQLFLPLRLLIRGVPCCLVSAEGRVQLCSRPGARTQGQPLPRGRGKPETERRLGPALGILCGSHGWDLLRTVRLHHTRRRELCVSLKSECVESLSSGRESPPESLLASRGHLTKNRGSFWDTPSKPLSYVDSFAQGDCLLPEWCYSGWNAI